MANERGVDENESRVHLVGLLGRGIFYLIAVCLKRTT
jgi:hypothetical protein